MVLKNSTSIQYPKENPILSYPDEPVINCPYENDNPVKNPVRGFFIFITAYCIYRRCFLFFNENLVQIFFYHHVPYFFTSPTA